MSRPGPYRRFDRDLDRICQAALLRAADEAPAAHGRRLPAIVADALIDSLAVNHPLWGTLPRPHSTELLRRVGGAYARALAHPLARVGGTRPPHYTPGTIAERLAELVAGAARGPQMLDPACGAGSLLLAWRDREPEAPVQGWDVDPDALRLAQALLEAQARERGVRGEIELDCRDLFQSAPQAPTAVLLNPPYGTQLSGPARDFARTARWAPREPDLFALALERICGWHGVEAAGAIVPDTIRMQPELAALRRGLLDSGWLRHVEPLDFGAFPRATVRPCLLVGAPAGPDRPTVAATMRAAGGGGQPACERPVTAQPDALARWPAEDPLALELWARCSRDARTLGELCHCHEGVHTGNVRHKLLTDEADAPDARPMLKGADIGRYRLSFRGRYVRYDARHWDRAAGEYASLRDPEVFRGPKLLSRQTSDHLVVCLDEGEFVTDNSLHTLRLREDGPVALEWLVLLLNSSLATALYRSQSEERHRPLPQIKLALLRQLPVRPPSGSRAAVQALYRRAEGEARAGRLGAATEAAIDALVFDSYGLPESDRDWIRSELGAARSGRRRAAEERA